MDLEGIPCHYLPYFRSRMLHCYLRHIVFYFVSHSHLFLLDQIVCMMRRAAARHFAFCVCRRRMSVPVAAWWRAGRTERRRSGRPHGARVCRVPVGRVDPPTLPSSRVNPCSQVLNSPSTPLSPPDGLQHRRDTASTEDPNYVHRSRRDVWILQSLSQRDSSESTVSQRYLEENERSPRRVRHAEGHLSTQTLSHKRPMQFRNPPSTLTRCSLGCFRTVTVRHPLSHTTLTSDVHEVCYPDRFVGCVE